MFRRDRSLESHPIDKDNPKKFVQSEWVYMSRIRLLIGH